MTKQNRYRIWKNENGGYFLQRKMFLGWGTEIFDIGENSDVDVSAHSEYLSSRITKLASKVLSRFPEPKDLLTGLN